jgi:RNA repair pathway DNA polymerase beta family
MDLIVKMKFGAHLYGTATGASDVDYKGVFMPSREQILLGRIPRSRSVSTGDGLSRNQAGDVDEDLYSLHYFIQLACEGQTVALDMLHAPEPFWLVASDTWRRIVAERRRFYSRRLSAFEAYAHRQAAKYGIRGSRLHAAAEVLALLKRRHPSERLRRVWNDLPRNRHCLDLGSDPHGQRLYQVCGKTFQESVSAGHVVLILETFIQRYGERARLAAQNKDIDWKAVSHALRAAYQVRAILVHGTIRYPLAEAPFLKRVKAGVFDYKNVVAPALEALVDDVRDLLVRSDLPEEPDRAHWDVFICDRVAESLKCAGSF